MRVVMTGHRTLAEVRDAAHGPRPCLVAVERQHVVGARTQHLHGVLVAIVDPRSERLDVEAGGALRIAYRQRDVAVAIAARESGLTLELAEPAYAVTPGQYAVFYDRQRCLGGAVITAAAPAVGAIVPGARQRAALAQAPSPV